MKRRIFTLALKFGLVPALVVGALLAGSAGERAKPAEAGPNAVVAFNEAHCVTLGVAFGGIPSAVAAFNCVALGTQGSFQIYAGCLANLGSCPNAPATVYRPQPSEFAGVDMDANRAHAAQFYSIIAFVDDDFPVRFATDRGRFAGPVGEAAGKELQCAPGDPEWTAPDPDCDNDPTTVGDGVVVARFTLDEADGDDGVVNINVIQENVGFPVQLTVTGPPDEITLEPLFGKDTIQTGATPASGLPGDPTACDADLSVDGVLGAGAKPEQTIVVAKALDRNDEEVSGAVLGWDVVDEDGENFKNASFAIQRLNHGGVQEGLTITPTLDTGALGIGFPQFVCGGREPGELVLRASFNKDQLNFSPNADYNEHQEVTINVIPGPEELQLAAVPPSIDCDGTNTSTVTATILNSDGDPVANGVDVSFSVLVLGTANPLQADSADGVASTVVTPLSGAGNLVGDGQPKGVTVNVEVVGDDDLPLASSILVECTGGPPPPGQAAAPEGSAGGAGGAPSGTIRPPDTGSGGQAAGELAWWPLAAIGAAAGALGVAGGLSRRLQ